MPHTAQVIHHIPGRMRVKLSHAKGKPAVLDRIKKSVSQMPGVTSVDTNSTTGSLLVNYEPNGFEQFHNSLSDHAKREGLFTFELPELTEVDGIAEKIEVEAEFLAEHSQLARAVVDFCKQVNNDVKRATNNAVDLNVLVPLGLAAYTFTSQDAMMSTPLWVTLGIFSLNSFVVLHSQPPPAATHESGSDRSQQSPPHEHRIAQQVKKRP
jgi:hypothetical protein